MEKKKLTAIQKKVKSFNYTLDYESINCRTHPEYYQIGRGEQGVLMVQPYKDELLPYWRFRTPAIAQISADTLYEKFLAYGLDDDFVGMDMARKFLQMGYTRARRYANHKSGKKYAGPVPLEHKGESGSHGRAELAREQDEIKAQSAAIFYTKWQEAKSNVKYQALKAIHLQRQQKIE